MLRATICITGKTGDGKSNLADTLYAVCCDHGLRVKIQDGENSADSGPPGKVQVVITVEQT